MAGVYSINIPSTAALTNPSAAATCGPPAPAIAAGTLRNVVDMTNAMAETQARKRHKKVNPASVTDAELSESVVRQAAVASELVADMYNNGAGGAGAPAWATPLVASVATLAANVENLTANVATIDARQRCGCAQRRNQRNHPLGGNHPFTQLVKCNANVGPPLPGQAAQNPPVATVGTVYPTAGFVMAPTTPHELNNMTLARISLLAEWANDDFGIVAGDTVAIQRNKLLEHYLYD